MCDTNQRLQVFFSWQSDLRESSNTPLIRRAIRRASDAIEEGGSVQVEMLDSPRGSGAQEIAPDLAERIKRCDVFVADVTIVHRSDGDRAFPNPNVVFEVGLAAAHVGWDRIILLSNDAYGVPEDQPFDYRGRTICRFRVREQNMAGDRRELETRVEHELRRIIQFNPRRPRELEAGSEENILRRRDIQQIQRYMSCINRELIDDHLERGYRHRLSSVVMLFDWAHPVVASSTFQISDFELNTSVRAFDSAWERSLGYDELYRHTGNDELQIFGSRSPGAREHQREERAVSDLMAAYREMSVAWHQLVDTLHSRYVEIDLEETDSEARILLARLLSDPADDD